MLVVPCQRVSVRPPTEVTWGADVCSVQGVVVAPVLELVLDAPADLEAQLRRDGDVAPIG